MRQIGSLNSETLAGRFVDYLLTRDIPAQHDADGDTWLIWIRDENDVESARQELSEFTADPEADRYRSARQRAAELRDQEIRRRQQAKKNLVEMRGNWSGPISRRAPLLTGLMIACVAVAILGGGFGTADAGSISRWLMFADPPSRPDVFHNIRAGQLWRLITPIFLHGGIIHLLFNMYWMYVLGGQVESRIGSLKFGGLVLASAIIPNVLQATLVGANFLGISGVVFAIFGYMWVRRRDGYLLSQQTIVIVMIMFALGFTPMLGGIAVWAHAGGLAVGAGIGYWPDWLAGQRRRSA